MKKTRIAIIAFSFMLTSIAAGYANFDDPPVKKEEKQKTEKQKKHTKKSDCKKKCEYAKHCCSKKKSEKPDKK